MGVKCTLVSPDGDENFPGAFFLLLGIDYCKGELFGEARSLIRQVVWNVCAKGVSRAVVVVFMLALAQCTPTYLHASSQAK